MKNNLKRLVHGIMSIITTFILMAAPVAAIVYSSESLEPSSTHFVRNLSEDSEKDAWNIADWSQSETDRPESDKAEGLAVTPQENRKNQW